MLAYTVPRTYYEPTYNRYSSLCKAVSALAKGLFSYSHLSPLARLGGSGGNSAILGDDPDGFQHGGSKNELRREPRALAHQASVFLLQVLNEMSG